MPARSLAKAFSLGMVALAVLGLAIPVAAAVNMTPVLLSVQDAPVPFMGSDGRVHLVYELWMTNSSSAEVTVEKVSLKLPRPSQMTARTGHPAGDGRAGVKSRHLG